MGLFGSPKKKLEHELEAASLAIQFAVHSGRSDDDSTKAALLNCSDGVLVAAEKMRGAGKMTEAKQMIERSRQAGTDGASVAWNAIVDTMVAEL